MSARNQDAPVSHLLLRENRIMYRRLHMIDFFFLHISCGLTSDMETHAIRCRNPTIFKLNMVTNFEHGTYTFCHGNFGLRSL
jgi:hypothetical protein